MLNELPSMLLFVPFNKDYTVPEYVRNALNEDEFFLSCFVNADFDAEIKRMQKNHSIIDDADDSEKAGSKDGQKLDDEVAEEIGRLNACKQSLERFNRWIDGNGNGVYCIKGDAGTGKTTYLHYLEYTSRNRPIRFKIVDLQRANRTVYILSHELFIDKFELLRSKVIAALLNNITSEYFGRDSTPEKIAARLEALYHAYPGIKASFPSKEIKWFFDDSPLLNTAKGAITVEALDNFAEQLAKKLDDLLQSKKPDYVTEKLWNIYSTILRCAEPSKKHIVAFDNIERFIRDDEISNLQISDFIENLRHIQDTCAEADDDFYKKFQMIVLIRNTSSRMLSTPLHRTDFGGHELNLSGWFPIDKIVSKKLDWFHQHDFSVKNATLIDRIIGKDSFDGCGPRSLQTKLGELFNNNIRVVMIMLDRAIQLADEQHPDCLRKFDEFSKNERNMAQRDRFAARSIMMRLVQDVLKQDELFKLICAESKIPATPATPGGAVVALRDNNYGYARKILTILLDFSFEQPDDMHYMAFDEFIQKLRGKGPESVTEYFDENNGTQREIIARVLFYMNYYNGRKDNWLHFIDIQCNVPEATAAIRASEAKELEELIEKHHDIISMRIMTAGKAFLSYIVHTFEYFSCRIPDEYLVPLTCAIPTLPELRQCDKSFDTLECFRIIGRVRDEAFSCVDSMAAREKDGNRGIPYKKKKTTVSPTAHRTRLLRAHAGYIQNFAECIIAYYENDPEKTPEDAKKLAELHEALYDAKQFLIEKI